MCCPQRPPTPPPRSSQGAWGDQGVDELREQSQLGKAGGAWDRHGGCLPTLQSGWEAYAGQAVMGAESYLQGDLMIKV